MTHPDYPYKDRYCLCGCGANIGDRHGQALYYLDACRRRHKPQVGHGRLTPAERPMARILAYDPCSYCGRSGDYLLSKATGNGMGADHIVARHVGGERDWTNLTAACAACNSSKGTESLLHFLLRVAA